MRLAAAATAHTDEVDSHQDEQTHYTEDGYTGPDDYRLQEVVKVESSKPYNAQTEGCFQLECETKLIMGYSACSKF